MAIMHKIYMRHQVHNTTIQQQKDSSISAKDIYHHSPSNVTTMTDLLINCRNPNIFSAGFDDSGVY